MHTFEIQVTPDMTRRAWNAWFFANGIGWKLGLAALLIIVGVWLDRHGDWTRPLSTLSIVTLTILGLGLLLFTLVYIIGLRRAQARLARIPEGRCTYTLTDTAIETASALGSMSLAWSTLTEVTRARDLLRLHFAPAAYSILPVPQIPPAALAYLLDHARTHGAKVTGV